MNSKTWESTWDIVQVVRKREFTVLLTADLRAAAGWGLIKSGRGDFSFWSRDQHGGVYAASIVIFCVDIWCV